MFKKALMAFAAVTAVSAAFAATSFAADLAADTDFANGKVTITAGLADFTADDQVTVLLIEEGADEDGITEDEILYINQAAGNGANDIFGEMGVLGGSLDEAKTYVLKVGSDTGADIMEFEIVAPADDYMFGDVNVDKAVDAKDVTRLLRHTTGIEVLNYEGGDAELIGRCDVNVDKAVDAKDVTRLLRHTTGIEVFQ